MLNKKQKRVGSSYPLLTILAKIREYAALRLFLGFFENHVLAELGTVFLELNLAFDELFVFARPIRLAGRLVLDLYEFVLSGHKSV
jgi:hypothetical protein